MKTMGIFAVILMNLVPASALAFTSCRSPESFFLEVYNCGMNKRALQYGADCAKKVVGESRAAGAALAGLMGQAKSGQAQNQSMSDTKKRLHMAIESLTGLVESMQKNTDLVASYSNVMIDLPDAVDDRTSLECFSSNFHKLQRVVSLLDSEIINTKNARESAIEMFRLLTGTEDALTSVPSGVIAPSAPAKSGAVPVPRGRNFRQSDVSGTERKSKK